MPTGCWLGIDLGTSGCRVISIDQAGRILARNDYHYPPELCANEQAPEQLWQHVKACLTAHIKLLDNRLVQAIAVDATSGSVMLSTADGTPCSPLLLYNDTRASREALLLKQLAPADSAAQGVASGLAKLLWLHKHTQQAESSTLLHQADWINFKLGGELGVTDYNNALKSGFDPVSESWPEWLTQLDIKGYLPVAVSPGTKIGQMSAALAQQLGLANQPEIIAGTTDSTAAFIATGAKNMGEAVTILGSTLVLKLLSKKPVFDAAHGIYSHRLANAWLTGGASNTGGKVLSHYFTDAQLQTLSEQIDLTAKPADFYPLLSPGERFPVADPSLPPRLSPRPADNAAFLYGLLASMAQIEQQGYQLLGRLSNTPLRKIFSCGGGSQNRIWHTIRQRCFEVPVVAAEQTDAAYGAALLARDGLNFYQR